MPIYHPHVLDALAAHGLSPAPTPPPASCATPSTTSIATRSSNSAIAAVPREFPVIELAPQVVHLRRRYLLLSPPLAVWTTD